jgi:hypothetical protein
MSEVVVQVIILGVIKEECSKDQKGYLPLDLFLMLVINSNKCAALIVLNNLDNF